MKQSTFLLLLFIPLLSISQIQIDNYIDGEAISDRFGFSVSLSSNGSIVAIGSEFNDNNGSNTEHVNIYDLSALLSTNEFTQIGVEIFTNPAQTQFTIQLKNGQDLKKVNIYSILG